MEKLFVVHITRWRGGGGFYITEKKTGKRAGVFFGALHRKVVELLKANAKDAFEYVAEIRGEPNPIPTFVESYELEHDVDGLGVLAHLTEKGIMRRALEDGGRLPRETPFGPMFF